MTAALAACLVATLAVGGLGGAPTGTAVAQADETTLDVGDAAVEPGENGTVRLSLDRVPDGLAGFAVTLSLDDPDAATVTGAGYPDDYQPTTDPAVDESGAAVTVEAADLGATVEPGATNVTLAVIDLAGEASGTAELAVTEAQVDADDGSKVDPTVDPGTVAVGPAAVDGSDGDGETAGGGAADADGSADDGSPDESGGNGGGGGGAVPPATTGLGIGALAVLAGLLALGVFVWRD